MAQVDTYGNHRLFLLEQLANLQNENTKNKVSNMASGEDMMGKNSKFVMLWNLSVISHLIFPQCLFLFLVQKLKIT